MKYTLLLIVLLFIVSTCRGGGKSDPRHSKYMEYNLDYLWGGYGNYGGLGGGYGSYGGWNRRWFKHDAVDQ
jgi:hypothetical protein